MVITKTPFRMSFFGGGTDLPEFFRQHGGAVLSTTFDKYCYLTVRHLPPFFPYTSELVYSRIEQVERCAEFEHPAVRHAMEMLDMHELRVVYDADLPARTGLGTSSSFAVGLLNAFYALKGKHADKRKLAEEAIYLERTLCGEAGGWQDQIAAAYGGFNRIDFCADDFEVTPLPIPAQRKIALNGRLMLFFTDGKRNSADIQASTMAEMGAHEADYREILRLVDEAQSILLDDSADLDDFGRLLGETWKLKRRSGSHVSNGEIDALYEKGIRAGALGGKLLGAGGGGFLLFYIAPENRERLLAAMQPHLCVPFSFEEEGASVIYSMPETFDCSRMREAQVS